MSSILTKVGSSSLLCFLVLLLFSQVSVAQFQGKIFTTPEERAYLDALRDDFLRKTQEQGFDITKAGPPPLPEAKAENTTTIEYALGGILTRMDGSHTVWLNNQPVAETNLPANMKLVTEGRLVVLSITTAASTFQLKPGQILNASTGEVKEAYQRAPIPETANSLDITNDAEAASPTDELVPNSNPTEAKPESPAPEMSTEADTREAP